MKTIVVDMDGTLSNSSNRDHLAQAKLWDEFHAVCDQDEPNPDVVYFLDSMGPDTLVMVVTGRPEKYRKVTMDWIKKHGLNIDLLIMRPDDDFTKGEQLKIKQLEDHFNGKENVLADVIVVLEDREKLVEAFRNYGLPCWQVRPGGY